MTATLDNSRANAFAAIDNPKPATARKDRNADRRRYASDAFCGAALSLKGSTIARIIAAYEGAREIEGNDRRTCDEILEDDLNLLDIACSDTLRLLAESAELAHREGEHYLTDGNAMMNALQIVADLITFRRDIANSAFVLRPSRGQS